MTKINLLVVDDEPLAHKVLERYCENIDYVDILGHCYDGISTLNFLNHQVVDVVLLDIQMPDLTGLELLDTLKSRAPKVIFTTAYTEYALQSFNYDQVVDYLHKPIRLARFIKALERLKKVLQMEREFKRNPMALGLEPKATTTSNFINLKDNKVIHRIALSELYYVQSWGNYLKIFLVDQKVKIVRKTIKVLESELPSDQFLRIHKSFIVNIDHVRAMDGGQIKLSDQVLPIGKSYLVNVRKRITG